MRHKTLPLAEQRALAANRNPTRKRGHELVKSLAYASGYENPCAAAKRATSKLTLRVAMEITMSLF